MKVYEIEYFDFEDSVSVQLININKDYTETEFKDLCSIFTCEEIDLDWKKKCDYDKEHKSDLYEDKTIDNVYFSYVVYENVVNKLLLIGFEYLKKECQFSVDATIGLLEKESDDNNISDDNKLIQEKYDQLKRVKKLNKILNG